MRGDDKVGLLSYWAATTFGSGRWFSRRGAGGGTVGALLALAVQIFLYLNGSGVAVVAVLALASFVVGWVTVKRGQAYMLRRWPEAGFRHTGQTTSSDTGAVNIDEFHGQMLAGLPVWFVDWFAASEHFRMVKGIPALVCLFVVFRLLDIRKPEPIAWIERRLKDTPLGVMLDDTAAGLAAALLYSAAWWAQYAIGR